MEYDKIIKTRTINERCETVHIDKIDWDGYAFDDPKHTACICRDEAGKREYIEHQKFLLRRCEQFATEEVYASNYGGWPRIWQKVFGVGMVSKWPYWEPRPCVLMDGTLGSVWEDWWHLTDVRISCAVAKIISPASAEAKS